jgi:hypothetical protein
VAAAQEGRGLHAVINNAGLIVQGPIELLAPADLRLQFDVNVIGPATVLGAFLPLLRAGRGRVVNISAATARVAALYEPSLAAVAEANASATLHPVDTIVGPVLAALSARRPKPRSVSGSDARALIMLAHLPVRTRDRVLARTLGLHRVPRAAEGTPAAPRPGAATEPGGAAA